MFHYTVGSAAETGNASKNQFFSLSPYVSYLYVHTKNISCCIVIIFLNSQLVIGKMYLSGFT